MNTRQLAEVRKQAYNAAYGYDGSVDLPAGTETFLDQYDTEKALREFRETPATWYRDDKPIKAAKTIALEAAVQLAGNLPTEITFGEEKKVVSPVLELAKEIYHWLTDTAGANVATGAIKTIPNKETA